MGARVIACRVIRHKLAFARERGDDGINMRGGFEEALRRSRRRRVILGARSAGRTPTSAAFDCLRGGRFL